MKKEKYNMISENKGFTLIELIIVTIVLGVLAAVAVPRYMGSISNTEAAAEASTIAALRIAVEQYADQKYLEEGRYSYPPNPFDYLEVDGYYGRVNNLEWDQFEGLIPDGAWFILYEPEWEEYDYFEIWHRRSDDNEYGWTYHFSDHTDLDGDDRGSNIGLCAENPNEFGNYACDEFVFSGARWSDLSGDPDPPSDGF